MKLKKITTLSLAIALCLSSIVTGCGKKLTPKEKLIAVTESSSNIKSLEATYSMNVSSPDSELAKITGDMAFSEFMKQGKMTQNISLNGMGIEQKIFMKDGKSYTSIPMMDKFLETDMNGYMGLSNEQLEALKSKMLEKFKTILNDTEVTESKEGNLTKLTLTLTDDQVASYMKEVVDTIFTEDYIKSMKDQISTQTRSQLEATGNKQSEEEINAMIDKHSEMTINLTRSLLNESEFTNLTASYFVDNKNELKRSETSMTIDLADSIKAIFTAINLDIPVLTANISIDYKSLNKKVAVDFSELIDDKIVTMEEYASNLNNLSNIPAA